MLQKPINVLFLCTGNSARSILSEALLNDLGKNTKNGRVWMGWSAGSQPSGVPHPDGLNELQKHGHRTDLYRSKSWAEFSSPDAPNMDIVITVCDNAAAETCPIFPGAHIKAHWPAPDPAHIEPLAARQASFAHVYALCKARIEALIALENLPDLKDQAKQIQAIAQINL